MTEPSRQSATGHVKFPPTLGFIRTPEGMVARLANTLDLDEGGSLTIMFTGERAEIAERLIKTGGRLDIEGSFDPDTPDCLYVDRFDVPGSSDTHSYGIGDINRRQEVVALDTTSATADDPPLATVTPIAGRQRSSPIQPGEHPEDLHGQAPQSMPTVGPTTEPTQPKPGEYQIGQRVRALDRGNVGTIVDILPEGEELSHHVRFVSTSGMVATRPFAADQIEPAPQRTHAARAPQDRTVRTRASQQPESAAPTSTDSWTFETRPDGRAKLALPTTPPHEIRIRQVVDDPDIGDASYEPNRLWEAEILWVDTEGKPNGRILVDGSRSQLVARALAELAELPSFDQYRTDQRWTHLVDEFAPDTPTASPEALTVPPRWASREPDGPTPTPVDPQPRVPRPGQLIAHNSEPEPSQASGPVSAADHSAPTPPNAPTTRPSIRVLPVHTRSVDPQTGAISI